MKTLGIGRNNPLRQRQEIQALLPGQGQQHDI